MANTAWKWIVLFKNRYHNRLPLNANIFYAITGHSICYYAISNIIMQGYPPSIIILVEITYVSAFIYYEISSFCRIYPQSML